MAGTNPNFNAADFRTAIQTAMVMGQSNNVSEQVTFIWDTDPGPETDPYSWSQTPSQALTQQKQVVVLNCAVEFSGGGDTADEMGQFSASGATLTLLDADYPQTVGAAQVMIGGNIYTIDSPGAIPIGLFDVTIYQLHVSLL